MMTYFLIICLCAINLSMGYIFYFQRRKILRHQKQFKKDLEMQGNLMSAEDISIYHTSQNKGNDSQTTDCILKIKENILLLEQLKLEIESPIINQFKIKQIIEMLAHLNGNLVMLENIFEKNNPYFSDELQRLFPDLTFQEIRLCLLLKLEFNTQDIALMFNVTKESIYKSRYRLRKKMNIMGDEGLSEILSQIH